MIFYSSDNIPLYFELHGSGPPLLLIAGLASDSRSWQPIADALTGDYTLIMPDNRGVGRSCQECPTSVELMADDCHALIRYLGVERVSLLGHSLGGMIAISYACRHPLALDKLILAATSPRNSPRNNLLFSDLALACLTDTDRSAWFRSIFSWIFTEHFFEDRQVVDGAVSYLLEDPWPQSPQAFQRQVEAIAAWDGTADLLRITAPTCVIAGDRDILFPLEYSIQLAQQIPGASLKVIEGGAHSIHTERPDEFVRSVREFLGV